LFSAKTRAQCPWACSVRGSAFRPASADNASHRPLCARRPRQAVWPVRAKWPIMGLGGRRAAYVNMMFDMRAVETNECHPDPERLRYYTPNTAPNPQECGRTAHLIDQVERDFFNEIAQPTNPRATGWGAEFSHLKGSQGYWSGLYRDASDFDAVEKKDVPLLEQIGRDRTEPLTLRAQLQSQVFVFPARLRIGAEASARQCGPACRIPPKIVNALCRDRGCIVSPVRRQSLSLMRRVP
jgi:hypothetical protein